MDETEMPLLEMPLLASDDADKETRGRQTADFKDYPVYWD